MTFRWNNWNIEHIERHGVTPQDAAYVVAHAVRPYPLRHVNGTWLVWGAAIGGRLLQVVYVIDENDSVFVVHARPLSRAESRRYRRRKSR